MRLIRGVYTYHSQGAETATAGTASERVDLRGDLAAHRRAGNDATEGTGADGNAEARAGDPGESEGRSEAEGGGGGDGDRGTTQGGSAGR